MRQSLPEHDEEVNDPYDGQKPGLFPSYWHLAGFLVGGFFAMWLIAQGASKVLDILLN